MKRSARPGRVKVTADGEGVVSHAGAELLREMSELTGLSAAWDAALLGTYKALPIHFPGRVLCDMAVAIADGADSISDLQVLRDQPQLFGAVASTPTAWRVLDRVSEAHLALLRQGRAMARAKAWAAGAGPDLTQELNLDVDATIVVAHSEKQTAGPTWKKTFGFHPLLCYLDRPEVSSGEALSGIVRGGGAGSNTAKDHICVLDLALASLPEEARPRKGDPAGPRICVRSDAAGATHDFAAHCRTRGVAFSFGFPVTQEVRDAIVDLCDDEWQEAIDTDEGDVRDGAWVAEVTEMLDLEAWPKGSRVVVRKERPHPGAQLSFFDTICGFRHTAFISPREASTRRSRRVSTPWSSITAATPGSRTGSARGRPPVSRTSPARRWRRTTPGWSSCSPQPTSSAGPSSSASQTTKRSHAARSPPFATASCTWQLASRGPPGSPTCASTRSGPGPSSSRSRSAACGRRSPEPPTLCTGTTTGAIRHHPRRGSDRARPHAGHDYRELCVVATDRYVLIVPAHSSARRARRETARLERRPFGRGGAKAVGGTAEDARRATSAPWGWPIGPSRSSRAGVHSRAPGFVRTPERGGDETRKTQVKASVSGSPTRARTHFGPKCAHGH